MIQGRIESDTYAPDYDCRYGGIAKGGIKCGRKNRTRDRGKKDQGNYVMFTKKKLKCNFLFEYFFFVFSLKIYFHKVTEYYLNLFIF